MRRGKLAATRSVVEVRALPVKTWKAVMIAGTITGARTIRRMRKGRNMVSPTFLREAEESEWVVAVDKSLATESEISWLLRNVALCSR